MSVATAPDGTSRAELEDERTFLLRSIEDLEVERAGGDLDQAQYERLLGHYTARAGVVLRALEGGIDPGPAAPPQPARRRLVVWLGLATLAGLVGLLLASSTGLRAPGETITGNSQTVGDPGALLEDGVRRRPDDVVARMAYARFLLGSRKLVDALEQFDQAARLDAGNAEARAYGGWILFLAGLSDEAMLRLDAAVVADPDYPDARFFRGMVLLRSRDDKAGAAEELRTYLAMEPAGPLRPQVEAVLAELEGTVAPSPTTP